MHKDKVIIAGGSGFIGKALSNELSEKGFDVLVLTRGKQKLENNIKFISWDGINLGPWANELEGAKAVVNLTGRSINCLHTPQNKKEIIESRLNSIQALEVAFKNCQSAPDVWVQASATGFYGDTGEAAVDEQSPKGSDFLSDVCEAWENKFVEVNLSNTRKVILRFGVVLGENGGALKPLKLITKLFLGGAAGNGKQYISWIHVDDICRIILEAIENNEISGIYNATAPEPVTNSEFMKTLRSVLKRPWVPPAPSFIIKIIAKFVLKTEPSLILEGNKAIPKRLINHGFRWKFSNFRDAIKHGEAGTPRHASPYHIH